MPLSQDFQPTDVTVIGSVTNLHTIESVSSALAEHPPHTMVVFGHGGVHDRHRNIEGDANALHETHTIDLLKIQGNTKSDLLALYEQMGHPKNIFLNSCFGGAFRAEITEFPIGTTLMDVGSSAHMIYGKEQIHRYLEEGKKGDIDIVSFLARESLISPETISISRKLMGTDGKDHTITIKAIAPKDPDDMKRLLDPKASAEFFQSWSDYNADEVKKSHQHSHFVIMADDKAKHACADDISKMKATIQTAVSSDALAKRSEQERGQYLRDLLWLSSGRGKEERVAELLKPEYGLPEELELLMAAISRAAEGEHIEVVKSLYDRIIGQQTSQWSKANAFTSMTKALMDVEGNVEGSKAYKFFLEQLDKYIEDIPKITLLAQSLETVRPEITQKLLEHINREEIIRDGPRLIKSAIAGGNAALLKTFIEAGAQIDQESFYDAIEKRTTPAAPGRISDDIQDWVRKDGMKIAYVGGFDKNFGLDKTKLYLASPEGMWKVQYDMRRHAAYPVRPITEEQKLDVIKVLVDAPAVDPNLTKNIKLLEGPVTKQTPLYLAVTKRDYGALNALLLSPHILPDAHSTIENSVSNIAFNRNDNTNWMNGSRKKMLYDQTPLSLAVEHNDHIMIEALLSKGANPNQDEIGIPDTSIKTPILYSAIMKNDPKIIKSFLEHGADIERAVYGNTMRSLLEEKGYGELVISVEQEQLKKQAIEIGSAAKASVVSTSHQESGIHSTPKVLHDKGSMPHL